MLFLLPLDACVGRILAGQVVDELLCGPSGNAAVADLPAVGLQEQLVLAKVGMELPLRKRLDDLVVLLPVGRVVIDVHTESRSQGELLLHRVGAMDVVLVLHVAAVGPSPYPIMDTWSGTFFVIIEIATPQ